MTTSHSRVSRLSRVWIQPGIPPYTHTQHAPGLITPGRSRNRVIPNRLNCALTWPSHTS